MVVVVVADYEVIADVGKTLITLLQDGVTATTGITPDSIALVSPGDVGPKSGVRLSLFLFQITESGEERNLVVYLDERKYKPAPLTLELYYMLTAYPLTEHEGGVVGTDAELILGRAMQIMHDNAILTGSALKGKLPDYGEDLHLSLFPMPVGELTKLWDTFYQKPF
ncbi:MAG: DUF4255 domain-containing protein, partial [Halobacteriota archaeon]